MTTDISDKAIDGLLPFVRAAPAGGLVELLYAMLIALQAERNQLITTAEADARVEAAVLAEHNRCVDAIKNARVRNTKIGSVEWALACEMIAAIRARGEPL